MDYTELKRKGRKLLEAGELEKCYQMFEEALRLNPSDVRIRQKVETLREALDEQTCEEDDSDAQQQENSEMVELCPDYYLHNKIYSKLFEYQREGLKWMYSLFKRKRGGVLGDDMGLGKTVQVISFLAGLYDMEKISSVLLVMPVSLIGNWMTEFEKWAPGIKVFDHHAGTNKEKEVVLRKVMNRGGVILTTYGMVTTRHEELCQKNGRNFVWDYIILDEGHRIKNPTKTQKAVFGLLAKHRLVLTGTAVQNNLRELWSLFHFTHQGMLFGNLAGFKQDFEGPINRGREKDAKAGEREMGVQLAIQLKRMIQPFFLRRTKAEVFRSGQGMKVQANKEDLVLWTFLSETQQQLYQDFLQSESVKDILMSSKSPLLQLNILKKICDHPRLLPKKACVQLGLCDTMSEDEIREFLEDNKHCPFSIDDVSDEDLLNESGKMRLTLELTVHLREQGHRTLIFSTSRRILDMIQRILRMRKFTIARLDGTITKPSERNEIVNDFQKRGKDVFLLTTQVGGVGLTLTNADRVIIYDPNWNPATDAQAVDRVFRIGQTKDVFVYRLITCGTIEEKIYSRQIFKDSIIKQTTGKHSDPTRYFTRSQLRELFILNDPLRSETQEKLAEMHEKLLSNEAKAHIDFLMASKMVYGVSHHDLLFSTEEEKEEVSEDQRRFISQQVERARVIREREADVVAVDLRRNPHVVPNLDMASASARNRAASMPSTINPENLRNRPPLPRKVENFSGDSYNSLNRSSNTTTNETFIDLSQDDFQDQQFPKHLHSTIIEDGSRTGELIIVDDDDDDDDDDIHIIKETIREREVTIIKDSDDDEFKIEDVTPNKLTSGTGNHSITRSPATSIRTEEQHSHHLSSRLPSQSPARPRRSVNDRGDDVSEDEDSSPIVPYGRARRLVIVSDQEDDSEDLALENKTRPEVSNPEDDIKDFGLVANTEETLTLKSPNIVSNESNVSFERANDLACRSGLLPSAGKKSKRRSVAVIQRASPEPGDHEDDSMDTTEGNNRPGVSSSKNKTDEQEERLRAAEEAAYDEAFEIDDIDESIIEKTILEASTTASDTDGGHNSSSAAEKSWNGTSSISVGRGTESAENDISMMVEESIIDEDDDYHLMEVKNGQQQRTDVSVTQDEDEVVADSSDEDL